MTKLIERLQQHGWLYSLLLLLIAGFALRIARVGYGLPLLLYEDEPIYLDKAMQFGLGEWDLRYFHKPGLFLYSYAASYWLPYWLSAADTWQTFTEQFLQNPTQVALTGRVLSVIFATASIGLIALIGRRLFHPWVGLGAAAFLAFDYTHIQYSPIVISDIPALFCILLTLWFALDVYEKGGRLNYLLCGFAVALCISFKYNGFTVAWLIAAHGLRVWERERQDRKWVSWQVNAPLLFSLFMIPLIFFLLNPMTVVHFDLFWQQIQGERQHMLYRKPGEAQMAVAWMGALPKIFFKLLPQALEWPAYITGIVGLMCMGWSKKHRKKFLLLIAFPAMFLMVVGQFRLINIKYLLPLFPMFYLAAAFFIWQWLVIIQQRLLGKQWKSCALYALLVFVLLLPNINEVRKTLSISQLTDTRQLMRAKLIHTLKPGEWVMTEADTLPLYTKAYQQKLTLSSRIGETFQPAAFPEASPLQTVSFYHPQYVVLNLKAYKVKNGPEKDRYSIRTASKAYYNQLSSEYKLRNIIAPYPIHLSTVAIEAFYQKQDFAVLYEEIQSHRGERYRPGPLLLLLETKQDAFAPKKPL